MGSSISKKFSRPKLTNKDILKKDINNFLSDMAVRHITFRENTIIQAEILMSRTLNYFADKDKKIPFLDRQSPPAYDDEKNEKDLSKNQFREYMKRVVFYLQYFLEL